MLINILPYFSHKKLQILISGVQRSHRIAVVSVVFIPRQFSSFAFCSITGYFMLLFSVVSEYVLYSGRFVQYYNNVPKLKKRKKGKKDKR